MKPIHLRFSGLQSYREPQEVDFQRLTEVGLFGIFGPTGSGKSTILDAITLALYGRVERAGGGIQGIMNMNSDELSVSFAFSLGERLFRVERSYRRNKAKLVNMTGARLCEETGDETRVLADKDVAGAVTELIGLDVRDFTRAVVLPQGKFAEFLTLSGKERRGMLERLFGLSAYGRQLTERVRARLAQSSSELGQAVAEQGALGDASGKALREAEKQYQEASEFAKSAELELKEASAAFEAGQQLRGLQEELALVAQKQESYRKQAPVMESKALELARSEEAEPLRHVLLGAKAASEELAGAKLRAQEAEAGAQRAKTQAQGATEAANALKLQLNAQEPAMLLRKRELEGAVRIEGQLSDLVIEGMDLVEELGRLEGEIARFQTSLMASRSRRDALAREVAALGQVRSQITIGAQERERLGEASSALQTVKLRQQTLQTANKKYQEALGQFRQDRAALAQAQAKLEEIQENYQQLESKALEHARGVPASQTELMARGEDLMVKQNLVQVLLRLGQDHKELELQKKQVQTEQGESAKLKAELTEKFSAQGQAIAALGEAKEHEEQAKLAARLAHELQAGQPCPVCGSSDHPLPQRDQEFQDYSPALAQAEKELDALRTELIKAEAKTETLATRLGELEEKLSQLEATALAQEGKLPLLWQQNSNAELQEKLAGEEEAYRKLKSNAARWQEEEELLQQELSQLAGKLSSWEKKEAALAATAKAADGSLKEAQEELESSQRLLYKAREEFAAPLGELTQEELEVRLLQVASWDRQLEQLQKQEAGILEELSQAREQVEEAASKLEESKLALTQVEAQKREDDKKQSQLQEELGKLTGGEAASELLKKLEEKHSQLKAEATVLGQRADEAQKLLAKAQGELERSAEALSGAQARFQRLEQELEAGLAKCAFAAPEELAQVLRTEGERKQLRESLEVYRQETLLLEQEQARLEALIAGRELSLEEWTECEKEYQKAQELSQDAYAKRGAAGENYRQLQTRHKRWQELEAIKRELRQKTDRLETLQSVLRGNVFVDFLAEEQLASIAQDATARLTQLTGGHYSLQIGEDCNFEIVDHFSGNLRRPVNTLSGGETFLASLALALALSTHIQLQGTYPLEFFFLDEGFGTLDPELLETVMSALETLQQERMTIGVISHVPELRQRLARRLYIEPAQPLGRGSRIFLEVG